jgi:NADH:ubiquinone oxidoreductase subunit 5 (subunit L)/multisubunit Na+/H+ antiporter MnhA subunit
MRIQANKSSLQAVFVNRFGDFGLFIAIMLIFMVFKSLNFGVVFILIPYFFLENFYF